MRQAISLAINREQLYKLGEYGYEPVASPTGLVLPNNAAWVNPNLPKSDLSFSLNPSQSVQILEKAGFKKNSQGIFEKDGKPLSFTLQVVAGWPDWDTDCQLIEEQLKKIGIQVKVEEDQYGAYYNNLTAKTPQYQLAISWTNVGPTPYFLYQNMLSPKGNFNVERLNDPQVTALLNNFAGTDKMAQQKQDVYKLEKYMAEQLPSIPLVYGATWYEYNDSQWTGWPTPQDPYINPAPWTNPAEAIVLMHLKPAK